MAARRVVIASVAQAVSELQSNEVEGPLKESYAVGVALSTAYNDGTVQITTKVVLNVSTFPHNIGML